MADEKNLNEEEEMTVTLTLDDDSEIECVVLNIFSAGDREYIALLPMEGAESEEEKFICTVTARQKMELLFWITLWMMMNTRSLQMHLTKC